MDLIYSIIKILVLMIILMIVFSKLENIEKTNEEILKKLTDKNDNHE